MKIEYSFMVGAEETGQGAYITNKGLLDSMTNMASYHAHQVNQGIADSGFKGLGWVVLNWRLEVLGKRPLMCTAYKVVTWSNKYTKVFADREFEFYDENDTLFAIGSSRWTAIDLEKRGLVRLTDDIMNAYESENISVFKNDEFRKLALPQTDPVQQKKASITRSMVDCYGHTHNTAYLNLAEEVLPEELNPIYFNKLEIFYKKEIPPRTDILLEYYNENGSHRVLIKDENGKTLHADIVFGTYEK